MLGVKMLKDFFLNEVKNAENHTINHFYEKLFIMNIDIF